ncbi:MAG TPA: hypothetical protein VFN61_09400 [Acidimicrobiales bacterium]|nr:hypothetical protein [Acidimicrobiales bacterium]
MNAIPAEKAGQTCGVVSVAVDVARVSEVRDIRHFGLREDEHLGDVFSDDELGLAQWCLDADGWLTCALALKRAAAKALRAPALAEAWRAVTVAQGPDGRWSLELSGQLAGVARARGVGDFAATVEPGTTTATATVLAMRDPA